MKIIGICKQKTTELGFTLLEVLVAISLLSIGLVVLLDAQGGGIQMTRYAKNMTTATQLARAQMALLMQKIEDKKITFGLSKSSCKEGDFSDDSKQFKKFRWKWCIKKVEVAMPTNLPGMAGPKTGDDHDPKAQGAQSLMSSMGINAGATSTAGIASSLGPFMGMIQTQMKAVFKQLQESLRELQVVIYWKQDGQKYRLAVTSHLFHFNLQTGMPDGWPAPKPGTQ